jgi:hypothetical protein
MLTFFFIDMLMERGVNYTLYASSHTRLFVQIMLFHLDDLIP